MCQLVRNFPQPPLMLKRLSPVALALALVLTACETPAPAKSEAPPLAQRVNELEHRVERLEARPAVQPPLRSKEEIEAHIKSLEAERAKLRVDYLPQHPAIRDIDRRLDILNAQLKMAP